MKEKEDKFTYCQGEKCPNRMQCRRFTEGLDLLKERSKHVWIKSCRNAKLFIHKNGSEDVTI